MKKLASHIKSWVGLLPQTSLWEHTLVQSFCMSWGIALAAQIKLPFHPVPMAMQSFAVILIALVATPRVAVKAVLLYLGYAVLGLPVLAGSITGPAIFTIPTAGYLLGYILMAGTISFLVQRYPRSNFWVRFGFVLCGTVLMFALGLAWLTHLLGYKTALQAGLYPFVGTALTKAALAAYLSLYLRKE